MSEFITSRGVKVECLPIAMQLWEKVHYAHLMPEPPTYEVKTATGVIEHHAHDETTLETDADRAAWTDYQKRLDEAGRKYHEAFMRLILMRGVRVDAPADDGWIAEQESLGITVPQDPVERKLHWLMTEVFVSAEDYVALVEKAGAASGVPEEDMAQAAISFRRALGHDSAGETTAETGGNGVADQQPVRGNARRSKKRHS